jgi:FKBP-type peptidyl-prolyl cis-trans isomerase
MKRLFVAAGLSLLLAACGHGGSSAQAAQKTAQAGETPAADASFLAQNAKAPGVVVLPSGLQYKIIHSGPTTAPRPGPADEVKVNYEGKLVNGTIFDSSFQRGEPADLPLQGLIPGWIEALQLMHPGDEWMLYVPPSLGYGAQSPDPIPPNSVLVFRIQLLGVLQHPSGQG